MKKLILKIDIIDMELDYPYQLTTSGYNFFPDTPSYNMILFDKDEYITFLNIIKNKNMALLNSRHDYDGMRLIVELKLKGYKFKIIIQNSVIMREEYRKMNIDLIDPIILYNE
jgi:hypothetical protein